MTKIKKGNKHCDPHVDELTATENLFFLLVSFSNTPPTVTHV